MINDDQIDDPDFSPEITAGDIEICGRITELQTATRITADMSEFKFQEMLQEQQPVDISIFTPDQVKAFGIEAINNIVIEAASEFKIMYGGLSDDAKITLPDRPQWMKEMLVSFIMRKIFETFPNTGRKMDRAADDIAAWMQEQTVQSDNGHVVN